jgi:hypothetical protein
VIVLYTLLSCEGVVGAKVYLESRLTNFLCSIDTIYGMDDCVVHNVRTMMYDDSNSIFLLLL